MSINRKRTNLFKWHAIIKNNALELYVRTCRNVYNVSGSLYCLTYYKKHILLLYFLIQ